MLSALNFGPILRAAWKNKISHLLIILQVAITMAIVTNAISIIQQRYALTQRDSGVDEQNSFSVMNYVYKPGVTIPPLVEEDLLMLRAMPGIKAVVQSESIPGSGYGGWLSLSAKPTTAEGQTTDTSFYITDEQGLEAFDLELIAGEFFQASDISWARDAISSDFSQVIISKALAEHFFGEGGWRSAPGKVLYYANRTIMIKGVIDRMMAPWVNWKNIEFSVLLPLKVESITGLYFIRANPGEKQQLMEKIPEIMLEKSYIRLPRKMRSLDQALEKSYKSETAMINTLLLIMCLLLLITSLGIMGLVSFTINKRKKQIGTRRALGATRSNILSYFMLENLVTTLVGTALGCLLTIGLNIYLVQAYQIPPLPLYTLPVAVFCLLLLGQLAVLWPAAKAAQVSPALATRTV